MIEFKAEQARRMAEDNIDLVSKTQREEIFDLIQKEISKGSFSCFYYKNLKNETIEHLKKLNYKVENQSNQFDGSQYKISW